MRKEEFQVGFPGELRSVRFTQGNEDGRPRAALSGLGFLPSPLPPAIDLGPFLVELYPLLERANHALDRLDGAVDALPGRTALLGSVRTREVKASSQIENTFAAAREIARASLEEAEVPPAWLEVARNKRAVERGLESTLPISTRLLREMHGILVVDPKKRPGLLRDIQVCIGDESRGFEHARFVPPPPDAVEGCLKAWELFVNPEASNAPQRRPLPYLVELAMSHYQFEAIHPFSDGNGRLGRAIITLSPIKQGRLRHPVCNVSPWIEPRRQDYYERLLHVSTHGDWLGWVGFFCMAVAEQAEDDFKRAEALGALYARYAAALTQKRASALRTRLLDHVFNVFGVTITSAAEVLGVSYPAASRHVDAFVKAGVLREIPDRKYNRMFLADEILDLIDV